MALMIVVECKLLVIVKEPKEYLLRLRFVSKSNELKFCLNLQYPSLRNPFSPDTNFNEIVWKWDGK